jgi:hypothetical protein
VLKHILDCLFFFSQVSINQPIIYINGQSLVNIKNTNFTDLSITASTYLITPGGNTAAVNNIVTIENVEISNCNCLNL